MKTRELKAFLKKKGIFVDDCFDTDSLIQRAAATEEDWGSSSERSKADSVSKSADVSNAAKDRPPEANEIQKAWDRLCEAWPGESPRVLGPHDADKTVIMLHGFGDENAQFLSDTFQPLLNTQGLRLILPQAPKETLQGQQLQSWFLPMNGQWIIDDQVVQPVAAYLHAMVRREIALGVPAHRIIIGGFAQGAGCAVRAALSFPDAPLGGAIALSGFFGAPEVVSSLAAMPWGYLLSEIQTCHLEWTSGMEFCSTLHKLIHDSGIAPSNRRLPVLICHGKTDEVVPFDEGARMATLLGKKDSQMPVVFKEYDMKHGIASDEMMSILEFVDQRMSEVPAEPLAFDPANLAPDPEPQTPSTQTQLEEEAGVPTMDPQLTLQLLNDQEIADAATDPEGMAVIQDVIMDPSNLELHKQNPRVSKLVAKLEQILTKGGAGAA
ncbi:unnamed protein product [Symbiodinium pilosum]|uniref:Phospholipase/carboxylesterase/thioesterase domain-containing protein n=1 Tax=Symbiodinium pilosum TaxID=2952 RepID=A0A812IPM0_SYMPI|nr:unnamed protein product [Symbiodinium pilosum]